MLSTVVLGFLLGIRHAIEADHVAAVATIVSEQRSVWRSSLAGALWGAGHTFSLLIAGLAILGLHLVVPRQAVLFIELLVGVMLVGLGVRGIWRARPIRLHRHVHLHGASSHMHLHLHVGGDVSHGHGHIGLPRRSFWIGLLHGLAGSGPLTVLALAAVPTVAAGVAYIVVFGIGSVLGMVLMSTLIGMPVALVAGRFGAAHLHLQRAVGIISAAIGAKLIWDIVKATIG